MTADKPPLCRPAQRPLDETPIGVAYEQQILETSKKKTETKSGKNTIKIEGAIQLPKKTESGAESG
jgi:hypothetical protein